MDVFIAGGVERVVIEAARILSTYYDVVLYVYTGVIDDNIRKEIENYATVELGNVKMDANMLLQLSIPHLGGKIIRRAIKKKYDCVIVCKSSLNCAVFSDVSKKFIYWNHGDKDVIYTNNKGFSLFRRINKIRLTYIYKHFSLILNLTPEINESVSKAFHLSRSAVLVNPINCQVIVEKSQEKQNVNIDWDKLTIVSVGRLSQEKGFCRLIKELDGIDKEQYQVLILGDGVQRSELKALIYEMRLDNNVHLLGTQINPYWFIKNADLLVSASETESFGLTMLEAMLLRTPVLATNTVGSRFLLKNGLLGCIVKNDKEFHESLREFIKDPGIFRKNVEKAHERAFEFGTIYFQRELLQFVQSVLKQ